MTEETNVSTAQRPYSAAAALSNHMVRLYARYFGRGPTRARTTLNTNVAVVVMGETMTRAEENLVAAGEGEAVRSMRRTLQGRMRGEALAIVEELLNRTVLAYTADVDTEANMATVVFVLEPRNETGHVDVADAELP